MLSRRAQRDNGGEQRLQVCLRRFRVDQAQQVEGVMDLCVEHGALLPGETAPREAEAAAPADASEPGEGRVAPTRGGVDEHVATAVSQAQEETPPRHRAAEDRAESRYRLDVGGVVERGIVQPHLVGKGGEVTEQGGPGSGGDDDQARFGKFLAHRDQEWKCQDKVAQSVGPQHHHASYLRGARTAHERLKGRVKPCQRAPGSRKTGVELAVKSHEEALQACIAPILPCIHV